MHIAVQTIDFHLEGCFSLKEKRSRLWRLKDRFGRMPNVAVCQSGKADSHDESEWTFVAVGATRAIVDATLDKLMDRIEGEVDAIVVGEEREYL